MMAGGLSPKKHTHPGSSYIVNSCGEKKGDSKKILQIAPNSVFEVMCICTVVPDHFSFGVKNEPKRLHKEEQRQC